MLESLLENFRAGDARAAARLMTIVERGGEEADRVLDAVYPMCGKAYRVAVTGATGSGKSTLVDALTSRHRAIGETVGIVAVDPSSPFSGGAVLGDRLRMTRSIGDRGVFVRSLASRGGECGFGQTADALADVLDAFGSDVVLLESIGVGQLEHRIRFSADTVVVVVTPEGGDDVQGLKSGLMEVADVFVVNKSDRPRAAEFRSLLAGVLDIRGAVDGWNTPVVESCATKPGGDRTLADAISAHKTYLDQGRRLEARRRVARRSSAIHQAESLMLEAFRRNCYKGGRVDAILKRVDDGTLSPRQAASRIAGAVISEDERSDE